MGMWGLVSGPRVRVSPPWWLNSLGNVEASWTLYSQRNSEALGIPQLPSLAGLQRPQPYCNVVPTSRTELVLGRELVLCLGCTWQSPGSMKHVPVPQPHPESWIQLVWGMAWERGV